MAARTGFWGIASRRTIGPEDSRGRVGAPLSDSVLLASTRVAGYPSKNGTNREAKVGVSIRADFSFRRLRACYR
jgi:hypothetical protein